MKKSILIIGVSIIAMVSTVMVSYAEEMNMLHLEWIQEGNKNYWYENGKRQGTTDDVQGVMGDGTVRGREIFDPKSDGWYWLDAVYDGAKACNKEVWMPYIYQDENAWDEDKIRLNAADSNDMANQVIQSIHDHVGKWVRYDANGKMYKGWYTVEGNDLSIYPNQAGNTYYYDYKTGLMAKGRVEIDGVLYFFDPVTGVLANISNVCEFGAIANDNSDDTKAFNEAIEAMSIKGGAVYVPEGRYKIDAVKGIRMKSNVTLDMDTNAVLEVIPNDEGNYNVIEVRDVDNVTIKGGTIQGERPNHLAAYGEAGMGIGIYDATNVRIENVNITENWGDGIYLGTSVYGDELFGCDQIIVSNCHIYHNRRNNIAIVDGSNVTIENCEIENAEGTAPRCGINIEPNRDATGKIPEDAICENITIKNTTILALHKDDYYGQYMCFMNHYYPGNKSIITSRNINIVDCYFNGDAGNYSGANVTIENTKIGGTLYLYQNTNLINNNCANIWRG